MLDKMKLLEERSDRPRDGYTVLPFLDSRVPLFTTSVSRLLGSLTRFVDFKCVSKRRFFTVTNQFRKKHSKLEK